MDLHAQQFGQFLARGLADRLQFRAALAQHDALLAVAGDHDLLVDFDRAVLARGVAFGAHGAVIGQFVVELAVELFAGDFAGQQALAGVGDLVFGVVPRRFRASARRGGS